MRVLTEVTEVWKYYPFLCHLLLITPLAATNSDDNGTEQIIADEVGDDLFRLYNGSMTREGHKSSSITSDVDAMVERLRSAVAEKERMPQREELIELIESGKHVLIGAKALALYTEPRFTEDTDYIVSGQTFQRIRKWMRDNGIQGEDLGLVLRLQTLAVDVIDARSNAVLKEILKRENVKPSPEALAAAKYVSFINQQRGPRRLQDVADFAQLVSLAKFDTDKLKSYMVAEYEAQWPEIVKLVKDIKAGQPVTI